MRQFTTVITVVAAALLLAACAKKEEPVAMPEAAPAVAPEAVPAPEMNTEDAEQSGGDKVSEPEPEPVGS